jgi:hypothetical protein
MTARSSPATFCEAVAETSAGNAQTALLAAACADSAGRAPAEVRGGRKLRLAGLLRRVTNTGASYCDPRLERPDLVEDDYYRFRNQPDGW